MCYTGWSNCLNRIEWGDITSISGGITLTVLIVCVLRLQHPGFGRGYLFT
jgi:hypothetical protein